MVKYLRIHTQEERKQLNEDGWTSSVKLSRMPEIGWTITWLAMSIKARGKGPYYGPKEVLRVRNSPSACGMKYYYKEKEIISAMKAFAKYCADHHVGPWRSSEEYIRLTDVRDFWNRYNSTERDDDHVL